MWQNTGEQLGVVVHNSRPQRKDSCLVENMIQISPQCVEREGAKNRGTGPIGRAARARPPPASSQAPSCIKKARPSSATPHNHAQSAQNCTSILTPNPIRPSLNSLALSPILRRSTIAARSRSKTRPPPHPRRCPTRTVPQRNTHPQAPIA
jgi:hypothetical protein